MFLKNLGNYYKVSSKISKEIVLKLKIITSRKLKLIEQKSNLFLIYSVLNLIKKTLAASNSIFGGVGINE